MEAAVDDYVNVSDIRKKDRFKSLQILIQAGTRAVPVPIRQSIQDDITFLNAREKGAEEMLKIVKSTLKLARKTKLKRPPGKRLLMDGISIKRRDAMYKKAEKKYKGDLTGIVDPVRCTLLAENSDELQLLSEIFRPCAHGLFLPDADFEVVRYRNEFNRVNPEKGGIRRLQVNVKMPGADGLIGEIMAFYGPSAAKYDISRDAYGEERSSDDALKRAILHGQHGPETTMRTQRRKTQAQQKRRRANDEAADFPEVRALTMDQHAYTINEFPVIINDDAFRGQSFAIVPNPASGYWETDQRFLDIIEYP